MSIKYSIFQTRLQGESQFFGRVILKGTRDQSALVTRMLAMGTSLTKTDIIAVLELLGAAIEDQCTDGYRVNLDGLVQFTPAMGGQFDSKSDSFTTPRNSLYLTAAVSKTLNDRVSRAAAAEKVILDENRPILLDVADSEADEGVAAVTVGHIVSVTGKRLKFDPTQPEEYLRVVNAHNPAEYLAVTRFHKISDQELVFRLPATVYQEAYFELANTLNTASVRIGRSPSFTVTPQAA